LLTKQLRSAKTFEFFAAGSTPDGCSTYEKSTSSDVYAAKRNIIDRSRLDRGSNSELVGAE
jgi:hypothetical protein